MKLAGKEGSVDVRLTLLIHDRENWLLLAQMIGYA